MKPQPPAATELTRAQHDGWACCWCGKSLMSGGVSAGISRGRMGAHALDIEVYACRACTSTQTPAPSDGRANRL
ncbi:hypothetical protein [Streptomyces cahuitamycinicus]|uniref:Uncharacterized protein n=1 Tax=Streptomyces cahuitamycinicus TaxID=2070367 RepID=A0A2N8TQV8_9ACTN|nr:hypothetical protein [Streptomyces cahuitamycinicus]PNG21406.1 hypothetical protein C1J00_14890 [Streptomyces cahuitamycinicus]